MNCPKGRQLASQAFPEKLAGFDCGFLTMKNDMYTLIPCTSHHTHTHTLHVSSQGTEVRIQEG